MFSDICKITVSKLKSKDIVDRVTGNAILTGSYKPGDQTMHCTKLPASFIFKMYLTTVHNSAVT